MYQFEQYSEENYCDLEYGLHIAKIRRESETAKSSTEKLHIATFSATHGYPHAISRISERLCYFYATPMLQRKEKNFQRKTIPHSGVSLVNQVHYNLHHHILFFCLTLSNHKGEGYEGVISQTLRAIFAIEDSIIIQEPQEQRGSNTFVSITE